MNHLQWILLYMQFPVHSLSVVGSPLGFSKPYNNNGTHNPPVSKISGDHTKQFVLNRIEVVMSLVKVMFLER